MLSFNSTVKTVGANGQVSLGKHYAGKQIIIEEQEPGVLLIRTAKVIPDNEAWLHSAAVKSTLDEAMKWAVSNPAQETNLSDLEARVNGQ
ncbi:MAG: hypothetical protein B7Z05_08545 [Thiotrichales bacterium 32-46-8]|jgi:hypothetical protein|nr:hypothetical protein [Gammaproteobacteria bacterium]OYX04321.1 MAG: hypothetical protein B7Z05_08545 [Thiotrichales bacterium 32-46-8]